MSPSPFFLARYSLLLRPTSSLSHLPLPSTYSSSSSSSKILSGSAMEISSKDNGKDKKDQEREGCYKGACDVKPLKKISNDILPHILNLYGSIATPRDFEIYAVDASFEDPLMCAHGIRQIKSAFYSLSKVFSESRIVEYSVKENILPHGKNEIVIDNKQYYKFLGKDINMISLIKLYVEDGKVVRHEDWWNKKPLWNRETSNVPLLGQFVEMARRGSMLVTHAFMRSKASFPYFHAKGRSFMYL